MAWNLLPNLSLVAAWLFHRMKDTMQRDYSASIEILKTEWSSIARFQQEVFSEKWKKRRRCIDEGGKNFEEEKAFEIFFWEVAVFVPKLFCQTSL